MRKFYKTALWTFVFFWCMTLCYGQQTGIVKTERSGVRGIVSFSSSSKLTGISNSRHVDGYVEKSGVGPFLFPVGHKGFYRPFLAESDAIQGAYFRENPALATLPSGGPFLVTNKEDAIRQVSTTEFWDIDGINSSRITLTWDAESNIGLLTQDVLSYLTIVGWNASTVRWEKIASSYDEVSVLGGNSTITSGSITSFQSIDLRNYTIFSLAALTNAPLPVSYEGSVEVVSCSEIKGWVWDKNHPEAFLNIELVEGNTVYAEATASTYRPDLKDDGKGTGNYGFRFSTPAVLMDGNVHQLGIRVKGSTALLSGSPKTLNCSFEGSFQGSDCYTINGWTWDKNDPNTALSVEIKEGATVFAMAAADIYREDLKNSGKGTGNYGFKIPLPAALKDGKVHQLTAQVKGINFVLPESPVTVSCPVDEYGGKFDVADCNSIQGWAWNKSYPNTTLTVELYEGTTVYATAIANIYREDLKNAGIGSGKYAFSIPTPAALKDGKTHQLSMRVKGSSFSLIGSPRAVTCAVNDFVGRLESASCNAILGWVWDKNIPSTALTVELYEGATVYATTTANIFREDLKNAGTGTGNYGFSIPTPASLKDGKVHQLNVRVKGSSFLLAGSPQTINCAANDYIGRLESASCNAIIGWVWDKNLPSTAVTVEIFEGSTVYATTVANIFREDIKNAGTGTGVYGFNVPTPAILKDGKAHQLNVRVKDTSILLAGSPQAINCAINDYIGRLESASCNAILGWVWDKNLPSTAVTIELFEGATVYATTVANVYREDIKNAGTGTGNYGFSIPTPAILKDGAAHQLSVRVKGTSTLLAGSPLSINCAANNYIGRLESISCNAILGWVWDKNLPSTAVTIELYEGTTIYATTTANLYREDLKNAGTGTGNYGFSIPTPAILKDGKAHQLNVRVKGTSTLLAGSPQTISCAANDYVGRLESANCNTIVGWVWDKNLPSAAVVVELYEGSTVYATATANLYRESLKNAGVGTGNYGFSIPTPAILKDGNAHQLNVRVKSSTFLLAGSPQSLTCATSDYVGRLESANCNTIVGWVWDKNSPSAAVVVELYEGSTVYATTTANLYRESLKNAGIGTGNYGFSIPTPAILKDGNAHQLNVRVKSSTFLLAGSPQTVTCVSNDYSGRLESANCNTIVGWVWDKNLPSAGVVVELYEGSTVYATTTANLYRESLKNAGIGTGNYGFSIPTPVILKDGKVHQLNVRVKGSTFLLAGSPQTVTCVSNDYSGRLESANCNAIVGWVWDKNAPSAAVVVELYEGSTVYATTTANLYRESLKNAGIGTGNYGFSIPTPAILKDGNAHQLNIRVKGSTFLLAGSPQTVTCVSNDYSGRLESANCNTIVGWVWDKNSPSTAVVVELYQGATVYATTTANLYRENLKNAGIGTGNYGFSVQTPAVLKDGTVRQLSARVKGTTFLLAGAPQTITCSSTARQHALDSTEFILNNPNIQDRELVVTPNPTDGPVVASFGLSASEHATLSVINLAGRVVWKKSYIGTGEVLQQAINLVTYSDKTLIIQLQTSKQSQAKRVIVTR